MQNLTQKRANIFWERQSSVARREKCSEAATQFKLILKELTLPCEETHRLDLHMSFPQTST